jgi:Ca2+-binding EF-hand superfamily protein
LNELLCGQQQGVKDSIHFLKNYLIYLKERSNIIESFKLIDRDNNGNISPDEIRQFMNSAGGYFFFRFLADGLNGVVSSEDAVNALFRDYDTNGDAMISLNEYVYLMMLPKFHSH